MKTPVRLAQFALALCPPVEKRTKAEAWKIVLSVLYNRLRICSGAHGRKPTDFHVFLDGQLSPFDGYGVEIPLLSGEERAWIEPFCDALSPEMESKYERMGQNQSEFTAYKWRKDHELTEREEYSGLALDAVEFYQTGIQTLITALNQD